MTNPDKLSTNISGWDEVAESVHWDFEEEVEDGEGWILRLESGLEVTKLPSDLPGDVDLDSLKPLEVAPDGRVLSWSYQTVTAPESSNSQNIRNGKNESTAAVNRGVGVAVSKESKLKRWLWPLVLIIAGIVFTILVLKVVEQTSPPLPVTVEVDIAFRPELTYRMPISNTSKLLRPLTVTITKEATTEATGKQEIPDKTARGKVRFLNPSGGAISLPAGLTIASAKGINYKLEKVVYIPGTNIQTATAGFAEAEVVADKAGITGNLAGGVGDFTSGNGLRVAGLGSIAGGTNRTIKVATEQDIRLLKSRLDTEIKNSVDNELNEQLQPGQQRITAFEIGPVTYQEPQVGIELADGQVKIVATTRASSQCYNPTELLGMVAPVKSVQPDVSISAPELGPARFLRLNETPSGEFQLYYTRSVDEGLLVKDLGKWQGSRAEFQRLIADLQVVTGVESLHFSELPADYKGQILIRVTDTKASPNTLAPK